MLLINPSIDQYIKNIQNQKKLKNSRIKIEHNINYFECGNNPDYLIQWYHACVDLGAKPPLSIINDNSDTVLSQSIMFIFV